VSDLSGLVEVDLVKIVIRETSDQQFIFLKERGGEERAFPIVIGFFEASAIDRRVRGIDTPRPMTHDLMTATIEALGARVVRVVVSRLHENTFYARLHLRRDGEELDLDCRPSDAIALAVQTGADLYVAEAVFQAVSGN
jgi:bifunctional DNase/RNase